MEIKVPFLKAPIGAGDVVKAATSALGIKPCGGCSKRAAGMNRAATFVPRQSPWPEPPHVPADWKVELSRYEGTRGVVMCHNASTGAYIVLDVVDGRYRNSRTFCCEAMRERAVKAWESPWR